MTPNWADLFDRAATYEVDDDRIRSAAHTATETVEDNADD